MALKPIKITVAVVWLLAALAIALSIELSLTGWIVLLLFGLGPPLALLVLWKDPARTMSERIRDAQQ